MAYQAEYCCPTVDIGDQSKMMGELKSSAFGNSPAHGLGAQDAADKPDPAFIAIASQGGRQQRSGATTRRPDLGNLQHTIYQDLFHGVNKASSPATDPDKPKTRYAPITAADVASYKSDAYLAKHRSAMEAGYGIHQQLYAEAMASVQGKVPKANSSGITPDVLWTTKAGIKFVLYDKLFSALISNHLRHGLARSGRGWAHRSYLWQKMVEELQVQLPPQGLYSHVKSRGRTFASAMPDDEQIARFDKMAVWAEAEAKDGNDLFASSTEPSTIALGKLPADGRLPQFDVKPSAATAA